MEHIKATDEDFVTVSSEWLRDRIQEAIKQHDYCILGLSGGSTPKPIYEHLGKENGIDWSKVWLFPVDDRYISRENQDSNQFLIDNSLLKNAKIPPNQIFFPDSSLSLEDYLKDYNDKIRQLFNKGPPDVLTLGVGPDKHIGSLFPPVVPEGFSEEKAVIHTTTTKFAVFDRATLTLPWILKARRHVFFLRGQDKLQMWEDMITSKDFADHTKTPAHDVIAAKRATLISAPHPKNLL
eukprot:TRINITY_DN17570_c0_g1_i1.p1 TRINITY_DN17570_c0_g1~~TRINITY_DN17570_c0_g1_i1.p1  ORF type:complete len:237 (+),score=47.95 TRINITY_DN17570_c0_g1_i1:3-713(+)